MGRKYVVLGHDKSLIVEACPTVNNNKNCPTNRPGMNRPIPINDTNH